MDLKAAASVIVRDGVNRRAPGIYIWEIDGAGRYVGKYTSHRRPMGAYRANVRRLLFGQPYRKSNPNGFRAIHHALAAALRDRRAVTLTIYENIEPARLHAREQELITALGATLNG